MPSRYYAGTFALEDMRLTLPTARGCPPLALRLSRPVPYPPETIRSVTLLNLGPKLFVDATAEVPVATYEEGTGPDPAKVGGVDLGIIHPYALTSERAALLVSGRAIRAEHRLHLVEKKARGRALATRAPKRGQAGSRRWRKYGVRSRKLEGRHRRRVAQATHEAARTVVDFAVKERIGTLVVGDPRGLLKRDSGGRQNLALRNWKPGQMICALTDKAALAGIDVELVDERGSSSTCPRCGAKVAKPKGRTFRCGTCKLVAHRDLVGAANIAPRGSRGGTALTSRGWRSCTVEPVGICPAGPGVTHDASRWISTVENEWIFGRLWPAPSQSGSRSVGTLRRPERGTTTCAPKGVKVYGCSTMDISMTLPTMLPHGRHQVLSWCRQIDEGPWTSLAVPERVTFTSHALTVQLAAAAALTERVRLWTTLVILPAHNAVQVAKDMASVDQLSDGRLTVGIGVGGRRQDYQAIAGDFGHRWQRMDDQVATMRRIWAQEPPFEGSDPVGPPPVQPGGPPLVAGVMGPKALARAAKWAVGVDDPTSITEVVGESLSAQRQRVVEAWKDAGRDEAPHFSASLWYALGPDAKERLGEYVFEYMKIFDPSFARTLAESAAVTTPEALRHAMDVAREVGCDEFFLVPTTADPAELDRTREALGI